MGDDISYVWTREGWLYLAVVIDLFARRVVGWATSDRLHKELALSALRRAIAVRRPVAGLIHHADRGSQYCSLDYQAELRKNGILISMSGKGNCFDNAMVETFFKTLKAELVWRTVFRSRTEATAAIGRYIDGFYNAVRRHSALDFISPLQFERQPRKLENALRKCGASPYSQNDVAGTRQRFLAESQPRQCGLETLQMLVTGWPPNCSGPGMPQRAMNQFALTIRAVAHDRRELVREDPGEGREVAGPVVGGAEQGADGGLAFGETVEVAHAVEDYVL